MLLNIIFRETLFLEQLNQLAITYILLNSTKKSKSYTTYWTINLEVQVADFG